MALDFFFVISLLWIGMEWDWLLKTHWGLVAQDVETVCDIQGIPPVVVHDQPETGNKHLNYMEFTAPIVKAIQELTERLEAIENG